MKKEKPLTPQQAINNFKLLNRQKMSEILALRAADRIKKFGSTLLSYERAESIIAEEFYVLDELVECLRDLLEEYELQRSQHGSQYIWQKYEDVEVLNKARALLERIEKGIK